jgi:hypothetical protein
MSLINQLILGEDPPFGKLEGISNSKGGVVGEPWVPCQEELKCPAKYELEDLLTMLSGTDFYSMDQIQYVYYKLRGEEEEAQYFLNILTSQQMSMQKKLSRMKLEVSPAVIVEDIKILT